MNAPDHYQIIPNSDTNLGIRHPTATDALKPAVRKEHIHKCPRNNKTISLTSTRPDPGTGEIMCNEFIC